MDTHCHAEIGGPPGRQDLSCSFLVRSNAAGAGSPRLIKKLILFFYPAHSDFFLSFYADFSTKSVVTDGSQRVLKPWVCHLAGGRVRMTEARTRSAWQVKARLDVCWESKSVESGNGTEWNGHLLYVSLLFLVAFQWVLACLSEVTFYLPLFLWYLIPSSPVFW
jgi:hypothetical protein